VAVLPVRPGVGTNDTGRTPCAGQTMAQARDLATDRRSRSPGDWHCQHDTSSDRTPLARMLPRVIGGPASRHGFGESCVVVSLTDPIQTFDRADRASLDEVLRPTDSLRLRRLAPGDLGGPSGSDAILQHRLDEPL
jgi:hypothetical protein